MNRETENRFGAVPKIHLPRSTFDESHSHTTTWNNGQLIPIFVDSDIMPGQTVSLKMSEIIRMATPMYPVMGNCVCDIYSFFVPHRLVWEHWEQFWGQNDDPWTRANEYEIPKIVSPSSTGFKEGTLADYMGVPIGVPKLEVNALPFRAYCKIYNDYFRDENLKDALHIYTDETKRTGANSGTDTTTAELGGLPVKVAKLHDYYTSALPAPQRGPSVALPLGDKAPVYGMGKDVPGIDNIMNDPERSPIFYMNYSWNSEAEKYVKRAYTAEKAYPQILANQNNENSYYATQAVDFVPQDWTELRYTHPANMWTDLSNATAATINELRTAFAIQKYYEAAARFGTRYIEVVRGIWGTESSDARLQRAEYLGGKRIPVNMDQILQTSSTDTTSPQGNAAGFSCTLDKSDIFTKSFEEHGTLMVLLCCRIKHSYQQGLSKMWTRDKWYSVYNPFFANLGEESIKNKEIFAQGPDVVNEDGNVIDEETFGYQERWAEYRYKPNRVSGMMRSNITGSLDVWHYADDYDSLPYLSNDWILEGTSEIDRTIAVSSQLANQFWGDIYFNMTYTMPMPVYSVPGLIDHV